MDVPQANCLKNTFKWTISLIKEVKEGISPFGVALHLEKPLDNS